MEYYFEYKTPNGFDDILMCSDGEFLTGLWFKNSNDENKHTSKMVYKNLEIFNQTCKWLDVYFSGKEPNFSVKYRFEKGTPFQKQVWHLLENIAFGKTTCYGDIACSLAKQMGKQKMSAQAVGNAVGANPICIIVPCHRVVGKTGKLVGYGGGIENKKQLLLLEKAENVKF